MANGQAGVSVSFALADLCSLSQTIAGEFDVVMAMDNAIPHLLSDEDLHLAAQEVRAKTRAGGLFLASIRDYDRLLEEHPQLTSVHIIPMADGIRVAFQIWEWQMRSYTTFYRALRRETLTQALSHVGFRDVTWLMPDESGFYQPVVLATA